MGGPCCKESDKKSDKTFWGRTPHLVHCRNICATLEERLAARTGEERIIRGVMQRRATPRPPRVDPRSPGEEEAEEGLIDGVNSPMKGSHTA